MKLPNLDSYVASAPDETVVDDIAERRFTQKKLKIFGKDTYYIQSGRRSKKTPTIVFLHGFLSDGKSLVPAATRLAKGRILVPDLPGFGYSESFKQDASELKLGDYYDWLKVFMDKTIRSDEEVVLIGYSFGAYVALQYLAGSYRARILKCILITPVVSLQPQVTFYAGNFLRLAKISERIANNAWRMQHDFTTLYLSKSYRVRTKLDLLKRRKAELEYFNLPLAKSLLEQVRDVDLTPYIRAIHTPVDIILAGKDNIAQNVMTVKVFEEADLNNVTWYELPSSGHLAPIEDYEQVAQLLEDSIYKINRSE